VKRGVLCKEEQIFESHHHPPYHQRARGRQKDDDDKDDDASNNCSLSLSIVLVVNRLKKSHKTYTKESN
jgi:hypothetical protein